jgi:hypothetical protein
MKKGSTVGCPTVHNGYTFVRIVETGKENSIIVYVVFYACKVEN